MAAPVIDAVDIVYPNSQTALNPGQSATITVTAHDPDAVDHAFTVTVTDAEGNTGTGGVVVHVADPLTYSAAVTNGGTVTGGGAANVFTFTADA